MVNSRPARILRSIVRPEIVLRSIVRKFRLGSVDFRIAMDAMERVEYAFGVHQALLLASLLRLDRVSVIEFGVAQGNGLLRLEEYAMELGKKAGIKVEVYGFDTGEGLPPGLDYRDITYLWRGGHFRMDVAGLQKKLQIAKLYLGNVANTFTEFLGSDAAPVGFISIDLDYYSSTKDALKIFDGPDNKFLPRVTCYFDDIVNDGIRFPCSYVGEQLAIDEFNQRPEPHHKLCPWGIWDHNLLFPAVWAHQMYVYHRFSHPQYTAYIGPDR